MDTGSIESIEGLPARKKAAGVSLSVPESLVKRDSSMLRLTSPSPPFPGPLADLQPDLDGPETSDVPSKKKRKLSRKECITCAKEIAINRFPKVPHSGADHGRDVCFECWEHHLEAQVDTQASDAITCAQCNESLTGGDMKKLATSQTYNKWCDKAAEAFNQSNPEFRSCHNASCGFGGYLEEDASFFICLKCRAWYCVRCEVPMHNGETCQVYQERKRTEEQERKRAEEVKARADRARENEASERKVKTESKECPNPKCRARLQKAGGCDHFTCGRCRYEFCWECFVPYRGQNGIFRAGNKVHREACRYHARRLPNLAAQA